MDARNQLTRLTPKALDRRVINRICDPITVSLPNGIGHKARKVAQNNIIEFLRDQMVSLSLRFYATPGNIQLLAETVTKKMEAAKIKEACTVGLRDAEALTAEIAQLSMSAFKSTNQAETTLMAAIKLMETLTRVGKTRPDQKVFIHYSPDYAPEGNFSIVEVADMRSIFLSTSIYDLLMKYTPNYEHYEERRNGYVIGTMVDILEVPIDTEELEGKLTSKNKASRKEAKEALAEARIHNLRRQNVIEGREELISEWNFPAIPSMKWNSIGAVLDKEKISHNSRLMIRLYLNPQLMYSRKISMQAVVKKLKKSTGKVKCCIMTSSFSDGIIDIFPGYISNEEVLSKDEAEKVFLGTTLIEALAKDTVGGIGGVLSMHVIRKDLTEYVSVKTREILGTSKVINALSPYRVSEIGRREFMRRRKILLPSDEDTSDLEWDYVDKHAVLTAEYDEETSSLLGVVDDGRYCILPSADSIASGEQTLEDRPTPEQITQCYLSIFGEMAGYDSSTSNLSWEFLRDNVWQMDISLKLYSDGIDIRLVDRYLHYCGIKVFHKEAQSRMLDVISSYYIVSPENPATVIGRHTDMANYKFDRIFEVTTTSSGKETLKFKQDAAISKYAAKRLLYLKKKDKIVKLADFETALASSVFLDLGRIFSYCYNIADIIKTDNSSAKNAIDEFVTKSPYYEIIRFPMVDKTRTVCNNWNTMVYTLGVGGAYNIHLHELSALLGGCGTDTDNRHSVGLGDFIWEKGRPLGVNLYGIQKHGFGIMSALSFEGAGKQVWSAFYRKGESITNLAVSGFIGSEPVGDKNSQIRAVAARHRMKREERMRMIIRSGNKAADELMNDKLEATNEEALSIQVMSMLIKNNPEQSIETFTVDKAVLPKPAVDIDVTNGYLYSAIFDIIKPEAIKHAAYLRSLQPYEEEALEPVMLPANSKFINIDTLYSFLKDLESPTD